MNGSKSGSASRGKHEPPKREAWCRGAPCVEVGAVGASAAVIGKRDGRRHVVVLGASERRHLAVPKLPRCAAKQAKKMPPAGRRAAGCP